MNWLLHYFQTYSPLTEINLQCGIAFELFLS